MKLSAREAHRNQLESAPKALSGPLRGLKNVETSLVFKYFLHVAICALKSTKKVQIIKYSQNKLKSVHPWRAKHLIFQTKNQYFQEFTKSNFRRSDATQSSLGAPWQPWAAPSEASKTV